VTQTDAACTKRYSKSSAFYTGVKAEFFSSNDALLRKSEAQNRLYAQQPPRLACKLCAAPVPAAVDFTSHGVGYKLCPACGHLNGAFEETAGFIEALYVDDGGSEYAKAYVDAAFETRVDNIYLPKLDFLLQDAAGVERPKIFDVGCGAGYFVYAALKRGLVATGIDLSRQMVEFGNGRLDEAFGARPLDCVGEDEFFDRISACDADVISAIGVLEHLRSPERFFDAFARSAARYVFLSVPMFSASAIIENAFSEVFPRQLSGAHTHLFTEDSIRWMYGRETWTPIAEWRFGSDVMDLYRALAVTFKARGGSDNALRLFADAFSQAIDPMQSALDRLDFCSEIHLVAKKG
jgi:SAM-dependent methyltransferase